MLARDQNGEEERNGGLVHSTSTSTPARIAFAPVPGAAITSRDRHSRQAIPGKLDSRPRSIMSRQRLPALISIRGSE